MLLTSEDVMAKAKKKTTKLKTKTAKAPAGKTARAPKKKIAKK